MLDHQPWLVALGFGVGALGTLIGAGGGFVLVPVLLLLEPRQNPETITSISLAVVFCNALSGSWAYARMRRIDYKSGWLFAAATIPGAIAGALSTNYIPRREFNGVFGVVMILAAAYLMFHRNNDTRDLAEARRKGHSIRTVVERDGTAHAYSYDLKLGMGLSVVVGYLSSLLGIGGGIIHVPALVRLLDFPVHIATATSHFILAIMALVGTIVHVASGSFSRDSAWQTALLGVGVLFGAQAGAWLSSRIHGRWIIRGLAVALGLVGIRILAMVVQG
ncbi:MAG: sulfite exporter TauE/SafE family protein [Lentisphaeria bacterium]|jgi:hypothetical protein